MTQDPHSVLGEPVVFRRGRWFITECWVTDSSFGAHPVYRLWRMDDDGTWEPRDRYRYLAEASQALDEAVTGRSA